MSENGKEISFPIGLLSSSKKVNSKIEPRLEDFHNPNKVFHHLDRVSELKNDGLCAPVHMTIGLTNHCNHKCTWCYINYNQAGKLSARSGATGLNEKQAINANYAIVESVRQARDLGLKSVTIVGDGEPTLHPKFAEFVRDIRELGVKIGIFSNLSYKSPAISEAMLENMFFIRGSIDAASAEIHRRQHGSDDFDRVMENLRFLIKYRSSTVTAIGVQYVVNRRNFREIVEAAKFYSELGVDYLAFKPAYKNELNPAHESNDLSYEEVDEKLNTAKGYENQNFKIYTKSSQFEESLSFKRNEGRYYNKCYATPLSPYLDEDGSLEMCGNLKGRGFKIGNVNDTPFKSLWGSDRHLKLLADIDLKICPAGCKLDPINKVLWNAFHPDDRRTHVDFV